MTSPPNVVLLVLDTLRADALSCYNEEGVETPNIDRLADNGVRFGNAFAAGPWTPTSHGTLFSGQFPSETGFLGSMPWMSDDVPLLADVLRENGYSTVGVAGPSKMGSTTGLHRGFDWYYEAYEDVPERPSIEWFKRLVTDPAIRRDFWRMLTRGNDYFNELRIEKFREGLSTVEGPFFAMMNLTTVHAPYDPPRPFKEAETPELSRPTLPLMEEFTPTPGQLDQDDVRERRVFDVADGEKGRNIRMKYLDDQSYVTDEELALVKRWYDAAVRYLDDQVGRIFQWFEERGEFENTIFVVTSDHGEFFGEHSTLYHGIFLHDEVLHVPLLMSGPGIPKGGQRDELVSLADVFPTICSLCDIKAPQVSGVNLFGDKGRDAVFAEWAPTEEGNLEAASSVDDQVVERLELGRKSIRTTEYRFEMRSDGSEELYTVPDQTAVENPDEDTVNRLRSRLINRLGTDFSGDDGEDREYSDAVERNLRQLGYLG
ncbi:DUF229 domain-containing protein [Halogeometricum borinquense]|uniref:DUF229 domain-containing protein n=1 Tax=Halogeometricum borinquense TaxID=60847 RepID=A0A482TID6_9EURY|nr:sulfatase [Halogeometricum borinquense]RYJ13703.1 DUF229 domain-containing protein [Halogeometricum borinquense]